MLSLNATFDVMKQLELSRKNVLIVDQGWFLNHRLLNLPISTTLFVTKQLELLWNYLFNHICYYYMYYKTILV